MLIDVQLHDPSAVYLTRETFGAAGDGRADDTAALQAAIDAIATRCGKGIVFVPAGTYRLTDTVRVWAGIRLIGFGKTRPVLLLRSNTPGFAQDASKYMLHFADRKPDAGQPIRDGHPGTFYSAVSCVDFEIETGNPSAVAVRFHVAQHSFVAHADFRIGDGRAGVEAVGNEFENCRFFGGEYGIDTGSTAPSWPFVLIDSHFQGQRSAAIQTDRAGMTIIRATFHDLPSAVVIRAGKPELLWMSDCTLQNVWSEAVLISVAQSPRTQVNLKNLRCTNVPTVVRFRETDRVIIAPADAYAVADFCHGLRIDHAGDAGEMRTDVSMTPTNFTSALPETDLIALPPASSWTDVKSLGATGDGQTDDTAALCRAIASHRILYLPTGRYRVSATIELRPDTVLIGLHPLSTQLVLTDNTPAFSGDGGPVPLLLAPRGGKCVVNGIGLDTGFNTRAVGCKWMAGEKSMMNDVRFIGGHGTCNPDGSRYPMYNNNRTADADVARRWDSQYHSLWITDGGGGTFKDIWTPSPYAQSGLYVSDTQTPGRVYALSAEHHVRVEVKLKNVVNWQFFGLQTEEERGEGTRALPIEIDGCRDLLFANLHLYRVEMPDPFLCAIQVTASDRIDLRGSRIYSPGRTAFDNLVVDTVTGARVRAREAAWVRVSNEARRAPVARSSELVEHGQSLREIRTGFVNADGAAVDRQGRLYFVDIPLQRIYRYTPDVDELKLLRDTPVNPVALAFDSTDRLLILTYSGSVLTCDTDEADELSVLPVVGPADHPGAARLYPTALWFQTEDLAKASHESASLAADGKTLVCAIRGIGRTAGLTQAIPGRPFYVAEDGRHRTWVFHVQADGSLAPGKVFVNEGEAGIALDEAGRAWLAAGQVRVFDASGKLVDTIEIPKRPTSLAFGGADRRTLFITARQSVYSVRLRVRGFVPEKQA